MQDLLSECLIKSAPQSLSELNKLTKLSNERWKNHVSNTLRRDILVPSTIANFIRNLKNNQIIRAEELFDFLNEFFSIRQNTKDYLIYLLYCITLELYLKDDINNAVDKIENRLLKKCQISQDLENNVNKYIGLLICYQLFARIRPINFSNWYLGIPRDDYTKFIQYELPLAINALRLAGMLPKISDFHGFDLSRPYYPLLEVEKKEKIPLKKKIGDSNLYYPYRMSHKDDYEKNFVATNGREKLFIRSAKYYSWDSILASEIANIISSAHFSVKKLLDNRLVGTTELSAYVPVNIKKYIMDNPRVIPGSGIIDEVANFVNDLSYYYSEENFGLSSVDVSSNHLCKTSFDSCLLDSKLSKKEYERNFLKKRTKLYININIENDPNYIKEKLGTRLKLSMLTYHIFDKLADQIATPDDARLTGVVVKECSNRSDIALALFLEHPEAWHFLAEDPLIIMDRYHKEIIVYIEQNFEANDQELLKSQLANRVEKISTKISKYNPKKALSLKLKQLISKIPFNAKAAMELVRQGADVNTKSEYGNTLLHILINENDENGCNDKDIVDLVTIYKADVTIQTAKGNTLLKLMLRDKHKLKPELALLLVQYGADSNTLDDEYSLLDLIYLQMKKSDSLTNVVPNYYQIIIELEKKYGAKFTSKILITGEFDPTIALNLVLLGADPNSINANGYSLLDSVYLIIMRELEKLIPIKSRSLKVQMAYLHPDFWNDINRSLETYSELRDKHKATCKKIKPLFENKDQFHGKIDELKIKAPKYMATLLLEHEISKESFNITQVIKYLDEGANPDAKDKNGNPLLHLLVIKIDNREKSYTCEILEMLIKKYHGNIHIKDNDGNTALKKLISQSRRFFSGTIPAFKVYLAIKLVDLGGEVNTTNKEGDSLLSLVRQVLYKDPSHSPDYSDFLGDEISRLRAKGARYTQELDPFVLLRSEIDKLQPEEKHHAAKLKERLKIYYTDNKNYNFSLLTTYFEDYFVRNVDEAINFISLAINENLAQTKQVIAKNESFYKLSNENTYDEKYKKINDLIDEAIAKKTKAYQSFKFNYGCKEMKTYILDWLDGLPAEWHVKQMIKLKINEVIKMLDVLTKDQAKKLLQLIEENVKGTLLLLVIAYRKKILDCDKPSTLATILNEAYSEPDKVPFNKLGCQNWFQQLSPQENEIPPLSLIQCDETIIQIRNALLSYDVSASHIFERQILASILLAPGNNQILIKALTKLHQPKQNYNENNKAQSSDKGTKLGGIFVELNKDISLDYYDASVKQDEASFINLAFFGNKKQFLELFLFEIKTLSCDDMKYLLKARAEFYTKFIINSGKELFKDAVDLNAINSAFALADIPLISIDKIQSRQSSLSSSSLVSWFHNRKTTVRSANELDPQPQLQKKDFDL